MQRAVGDRSNEANTLGNLMLLWKSSDPRLAIFYGKESVNLFQRLRSNIRGLDLEAQKSFLRSKEGIYHNLTDLLITQGRLPEAQQALNLYKDQEFFDFAIAQSRQPAPPARQIALTTSEANAKERYLKSIEQLAQLGQQLTDLQLRIGNHTPSAEQAQQLDRLGADLKSAGDQFLALLKQLEAEFRSASPDSAKLEMVEDTSQTQQMLSELSTKTGSKAAAVYTLVGTENFRTLLITPDRITTASSPVKAADLNQKALNLLRQLRSPALDPRPQAKGLYDILLKPLEAELRRSGAETLINDYTISHN